MQGGPGGRGRTERDALRLLAVLLDNWDTHTDNFGAVKANLPTFDKGFSSLMEDLARAADRLGDDPFEIEDILNKLPPMSQAARAGRERNRNVNQRA